MKILVTGSSGLVGSALVGHLVASGHEVTRLVRSGSVSGPGMCRWDPMGEELEVEVLVGVETVVHLSGESIAGGRWTERKKGRIRASRVDSTRLLSVTMASMAEPPQLLVCASAVGYYGDRGDELLTEDSSRGSGFLSEVCEAWERAADPARDVGVRVVHVRSGVVLSGQGGALAKMLPPFRVGLGGPLGSGDQFISWIVLDDLVAALAHIMRARDLGGPVNVASPNPVRNRELAKALGEVLHRPAAVPVPAFAARLALGEMADQLFLASQRMSVHRLIASGFEFAFPEIRGALRHAVFRGAR